MKGYIVVPATFTRSDSGMSDELVDDLINSEDSSREELTRVGKLYVNVNNISSFNESSIEGHCTLRMLDCDWDVHLTIPKLMDLITQGQETLNPNKHG